MSRELAIFMSGLIDYAGLFPPAALAVPAAVERFLAHRGREEAFLLGRFVAPAAKLAEVAAAAGPAPAGGYRWAAAGLIGDRAGGEAALAALPGQGRAVAEFTRAGGAVQALECALPQDACDRRDHLRLFLERLLGGVEGNGLAGRPLFLELPPQAEPELILQEIGALRAGAASGATAAHLGAKLRCGGAEAAAFPADRRVADVIGACARCSVPLKFTAGLHHPLRRRLAEPAATMHGFLNVLGASYLAFARAADPQAILGCLQETRAEAFTLSAAGFGWRDLLAPQAALADLRGRFVCGFGSCSFDEPVADLKAIGWLAGNPS